MKKLGIVLGSIAVMLASASIVACAGTNEKPDDKDPSGSTVTYTVKFEDGSGLAAPANQSVNEGSNAKKPADPERVGYTFDGWYLDGVLYEFTATVNADITLVAKYSSVLGGEGTAASPFTIDTAAELDLLKSYIAADAATFGSANYVQTADITWTSVQPISEFGGEYNGGGHTITTATPLFDKLTGKVADLDLDGEIVVGGGTHFGILANTAANADISRVTASGSISGAVGTVGGIVGYLDGGRIEYSESNVAVHGKVAGGIAGKSNGVIINSVTTSVVVAEETAGGAVGVLEVGGLIQNVGAGCEVVKLDSETSAFVSSKGVAGGIVGSKQSGAAVYRAFVYGDRIRGLHAGGIVGVLDTDAPAYTDVTSCAVLDGTAVEGEQTVCYGETTVEDFAEIGLPEAVWSVQGAPALKDDIKLPNTVTVTVNGTDETVVTGSHDKRSIELFTLANEHFSKLIEFDADVELKTASTLHLRYSGSEFTSGNYGVSFGALGAKLKASADEAYSPLTYVLTYAYDDSFVYTPDSSNPNTAYDVDYDAPVSVYTDGKKYYAFVVEKQYIGAGMYAGFMQSYVYEDGEWGVDKYWYPKSNFAGGAYKYTFNAQLVYTYSYMIIVDGNYTVSGGTGYYLTRFVMRNLADDGTYTESEEVVSLGQTMMYLGTSENNDNFITAFAFSTDNDGYSDFIYYDKDGKLVNSAGFDVEDASSDFIKGVWFDGNNKYAFDVEAGTVTVTPKTGAASNVSYTVENGKIKFTADKAYELALMPGALGSYMLVSLTGDAELVLSTYVSNVLDGAWITEGGDVIVVTSDPTYVTFNGTAATLVEDAVYNGLQAVRFTVGDNEYYLATNPTEGFAVFGRGGSMSYAVSTDVCHTDFSDEFVTTRNGGKVEMSIGGELEVTFGGDTAKAVPDVISSNEYVLRVKLDGVYYTLERKNDVVIMTGGGNTYVFATLSAYNMFVWTTVDTYTNGSQVLEINADGKYRVYTGEASGEFSNLTAIYREERVEFGGEGRGFVLGYTDGDDTYFFYADTDAHNVRLYKSGVNSNGATISTLVTNFVPQDELAPLLGAYVREYNNGIDKLNFADDGTLIYVHPNSSGDATVTEELTWYPLLNYNYKTQTTRIMAYTVGEDFTSLIETNATGISWGLNTYIREELFEALPPYTAEAYIAGTTLLTVGDTRIELKFLKENNGSYTNTTSLYNYTDVQVDGTTITVTAVEGGFGIDEPRTATLVLAANGETRTATLTIDDGDATVYTGETPLDYNALLGEYEYDGTTYTFSAEEFWGSVTVKLVCQKGSSKQQYTYYPSDGTVVMTNGKQALAVRSTTYQYKYIWKDGNNLMVGDSYDASTAIAAADKAIAGMPTVDELKEMLDGNEYTASDGSKVSFELSDNWFGSSFTITDGDTEVYCDKAGHITAKGTITLMFGFEEIMASDTRVVVVYLNDNGDITKLLVGETVETATKEYTSNTFVPPTVDEMKALLVDTGYKATNGKMAMFYINSSMFGKYYMLKYDGKDYDYNNCTYENGVYTFTFKATIGGSVTVVVTYTAAGVEKLTIAGTDYLPVVMPTADELQTLLDGKTFTNEYDDSMYITFEVAESLFYGTQFNATVFDGEDEDGMGYVMDKITVNGRVYTIELSLGFTKATMTVTLNPDGTVKAVEYDGDDYILAE